MGRGAGTAPGATSGRTLCRIVRFKSPVHPWSTVSIDVGRLMEPHGRRRRDQTRTSSLSADILPLLRSAMSSKPTF